ncbi:MAG: zinc-binding protein [Burkholderiales bacterium]|jgi:uncharacterized metal-binding protein|nr:zinc-binding protein [Burkholderiales bacterium]
MNSASALSAAASFSPAASDIAGPAPLPLVYSCSGCSSAAQLCNDLALRLDRAGLAEMSCIAGVGGGVPGLVRTAKSGRPILALDGCPLHCVRHCLERHALQPQVHVDLSRSGIKRRLHEDPSAEELQRIWAEVVLPALESVQASVTPAPVLP